MQRSDGWQPHHHHRQCERVTKLPLMCGVRNMCKPIVSYSLAVIHTRLPRLPRLPRGPRAPSSPSNPGGPMGPSSPCSPGGPGGPGGPAQPGRWTSRAHTRLSQAVALHTCLEHCPKVVVTCHVWTLCYRFSNAQLVILFSLSYWDYFSSLWGKMIKK